LKICFFLSKKVATFFNMKKRVSPKAKTKDSVTSNEAGSERLENGSFQSAIR